jgi:hypothetical protein
MFEGNVQRQAEAKGGSMEQEIPASGFHQNRHDMHLNSSIRLAKLESSTEKVLLTSPPRLPEAGCPSGHVSSK